MGEPLVDLYPTVVAELREADDLTDIVGAAIRTDEPHGATKTYAGDARGPGEYVAFLVVTQVAFPPERRVPVGYAEFGFIGYGRTKEEATAIYSAIVGAMHRRGPRLRTDGVGVYASWVIGGERSFDPKTKQPVVSGTIQLTAATQAVTA